LRSADGTLADVPKKVSANIVAKSFFVVVSDARGENAAF
jgi:hypothetical protein